MPYIYAAALYCDSCGDRIRADLTKAGLCPDRPNEADSDDYPQSFPSGGESDSPNHCYSGAECLEGLDLREWGLGKRARMVGAETPVIGALIDEQLTSYGVNYLKEMLAERPRTPYQRALHRFWRAAFADYL